eukprot:TRINITY_DN2270_c0_g1_i1.p1 TRINITY_DN2270_c0_g1~~TRINITY_DN2270_c0_g1_i1.p1  ORF type:complete len:490 (+),score=75.41 TRINITY_DN2270_c0_g1_i1:78-1547(+)
MYKPILQYARRNFSGHASCKIAIVGTGPSGFYVGKYALKDLFNVHIAFFDRLPTPFGLVRYGVAPDHPDVKLVQNDFSKILRDSRVRFFGNVEIGKHLSVASLRQAYHAVVLACGASDERKMNIPGEDEAAGVYSARSFVGWYNAHPDFQTAFDPRHLQGTDTAVIIGQGNVAVDLARILSQDVRSLVLTDIAKHAVEALSKSTIRRVFLVGRRGPVQMACTTKELRELSRLPNCSTIVPPVSLSDLTPSSRRELQTSKALSRKFELLQKLGVSSQSANQSSDITDAPSQNRDAHQIAFRFCRAPKSIEFSAKDQHRRVQSIVLAHTTLKGEPAKQVAVETSTLEQIPCGLIFRSVGYRLLPIEGVPFDSSTGRIPSKHGRILLPSGDPDAGLYVAGWMKRGPTGTIASNLPDAKETVAAIQADLKNDGIKAPQSDCAVEEALKKANRPIIDVHAWQQIDQQEIERGSLSGKPREKFASWNELLKFARV